MRARPYILWIAVFLTVALFHLPSFSQQLAKRLILKDGTYQLATSWEVKGDRVRYFSAERNEWEDIPNSMIDLDATNKYEKDRAAGVPLPEAIEFDKKIAAERAAEEAKRPQVAPGLRLPDGGGVLLLDTMETQPQLVPLEQKVVQLDQQRTVTCHTNDQCNGNRVNTVKNNVELAGPHADVQAHIVIPAIYLKLAADLPAPAPQELSNHYRIVRAQEKRDRRIVSAFKVSIQGVAEEQERKSIPASIEVLDEGWIKITPDNPLTAGEYVLVEMLHPKQQMNLNLNAIYLPDNLWDFGINPAAPANPSALKADAPAKSPADQAPQPQKQP